MKGIELFEPMKKTGWKDLVIELIKRIQKIKEEDKLENLEIVQVKEKFGGLRVYTENGNDKVFNVIQEAEVLSYYICISCGTTQDIVYTAGWILTMCRTCAIEKEKKYIERAQQAFLRLPDENKDEELIKWNVIKEKDK